MIRYFILNKKDIEFSSLRQNFLPNEIDLEINWAKLISGTGILN